VFSNTLASKLQGKSNMNNSYDVDQFTVRGQQQEVKRLLGQTALQHIESRLWQETDLGIGTRAIDVGCGVGRTAQLMAQMLPQTQVIGLDSSIKMIDQARSTDVQQVNLSFQVGLVEQMPFPDQSIDFVFARALFQHLNTPQLALQEIRRVLKPGGKICILDVDDDWFTLYPEPAAFSLLRQTMTDWQKTQCGDPQVGRKLGSYLQQVGFKHIQITVETVSSDVYGLENMLNWLSFGQPYQHLSPEILAVSATARSEAFALLQLPYAWAGLGLFLAQANKLV
jgi:ubiquinone/menaquinone biosynthesis C-methylase UbiE